MWYKYKLTCVDGGHGWGRTGQQAEMCAESHISESEARETINQQIPGGWVAELIGPTTDKFYLKHLSP